ncbi:hypothetical protein ACIBI9_66565 [Nonomuraea sp. NPDC050451]|uniref:hypothetical protein n=1 Tax=Nonomuraea sp. NPDC050451 TaxID=3364364 RepID=UPI0037AE7E2F
MTPTNAANRLAGAAMIVLTLALAWTSVEIQGIAADGSALWTREWVTGRLIGWMGCLPSYHELAAEIVGRARP